MPQDLRSNDMSIIKYMVLPKEVTDFENNYLTRLNKIALYFFYAHIPVFMLVAWAADTGPLFALFLSLVLLIGPTIAQFGLQSERVKSMVYGFTAMGMGGLLVHFGQGPVQIEMHFYFFALLAMLCMFANPTVNIVAAVTVALHHLVLWYYLPSSVFNYDASIWVVGVHALFVVLETVAACFISRRFFDDVIGLEKKVQERTKEIKLILNNIGQGFLTVDIDGVMSEERSTIVGKWFGSSEDITKFADYIRNVDANVADWFELGMETVREGILPTEVAIDQLPKRVVVGSCILELAYNPICNAANEIEKLLVIISDITSQVEREQAEIEQKQMMQIFEHIMRDKLGFLEFLSEADEMIDSAVDGRYQDLSQLKRIIHTIKGNSGLFGMLTVAKICHALEDEIVNEGVVPEGRRLVELKDEWNKVRIKLNQLLGERMAKNIEINDADYGAVLQALLNREDQEKIARMVQSWKLESAQRRLELVKQQTENLAQRMGKQGIDVLVQPNNIRFESEHWAPFWNSFVHVLRNAIDHGIESTDERTKNGKEGRGSINISTYIEDDQFVISVEDDGRGVDWQAITEKAIAAQLPHENKVDLTNALFKGGISTKNTATQYSGRGVGMSAVHEECAKRGGRIVLDSQSGKGTKIMFRFPLTESIYDAGADGQSSTAA